MFYNEIFSRAVLPQDVDLSHDLYLQNGLTPLHLCAQEDRANVASILVKNGAEVDATTKVQKCFPKLWL